MQTHNDNGTNRDVFYDFGFDFSGTGANIDFNIIHEVGWGTVRLKGCNVRNIFVDSILLDPNSYDDYIINGNSALFLSDRFTNESIVY